MCNSPSLSTHYARVVSNITSLNSFRAALLVYLKVLPPIPFALSLSHSLSLSLILPLILPPHVPHSSFFQHKLAGHPTSIAKLKKTITTLETKMKKKEKKLEEVRKPNREKAERELEKCTNKDSVEGQQLRHDVALWNDKVSHLPLPFPLLPSSPPLLLTSSLCHLFPSPPLPL